MTFVQALPLGFNKLFVFSGRSTRAEFWWMALFFELLALGSDLSFYLNGMLSDPELEVFVIVWQALFFIPLIPIGTRRLHDIGRTGWWQLLTLTLIGSLLLIVWWVKDSDPKKNRFGPSAKKA